MALYLVATPIGNLADITSRALDTLTKADLILAEDTRKTALLLQHYSIKNSMLPFHEHNEVEKLPSIINLLLAGKEIALVSDAGTPTISDPGFKLVRQAAKENIEIFSIPGASAVLTALSLSGLPTERFLYLGYLPKSAGKIEKILQETKEFTHRLPTSVILFESPHRLMKTLETLERVFPEADIAVTKELTKIHETVLRGKISQVASELKTQSIKGEFTLVLRN